jgi:plasmid stability protein
MSSQSITVDLPDSLYEQLKQRASLAHHTIEDELLEVVSTIVPVAGELTPFLRDLLAQMENLEDEKLWQTARRHLSKKALAQLQSLNYKRQREGLTEAETSKSNALLKEYEQIILVRAQAARILKERGHNISQLLAE